jgi:hypothetical protein
MEASRPFVAVDNGSVRPRKKQWKPKVEKAIVAQVLYYANESNDAPSDKKQIVEGINRLPQIISYDERHHMLLPHSLLNYSQYVEEQSNMPFWFSGIEEFARHLFEKQFRTKPLIRNKKERNLTADLIFMALLTGLRPQRKMVHVPSWNKCDETLPYHFFGAAKPLLTDSGCLVLLYLDLMEHVEAVLEAVKNVPACWFLWSWLVPRNTIGWGQHNIEVISL